MILDTNILYNQEKDTLYILIYKLGEGSYAEVWFCIEIPKLTYHVKIKKPFEYSLRALKIHMDDSFDEGMLETRINEVLTLNNKKCENINYPLGYFVHEETYVVVIYELAVGSLYDVLKKFNRKLNLLFIEKIIPQLIKSIKYVHNCGYIHSDIKPENFLLMGTTKKQNDILIFTKKYNLDEKLRKL